MTTVLTVDHLTVRRAGRTIIDELSLEVAAGQILGVVGANGCGKTTLLASIAGVLPPRDGRIAIAGASVWGSRRDRQRARAALGYVPEGADPPGFLLASELWALCATSRRAPMPTIALREALDLDELSGTAIERMSLGQRRRACLGAALIGAPALLVLDEPDNGLDARRLAALATLLADHVAHGGAVILASHDAAWLDRLGARHHALP